MAKFVVPPVESVEVAPDDVRHNWPINIDLCYSIEKGHWPDENNWRIIFFTSNDNHSTWYFESEMRRDYTFKSITEGN